MLQVPARYGLPDVGIEVDFIGEARDGATRTHRFIRADQRRRAGQGPRGAVWTNQPVQGSTSTRMKLQLRAAVVAARGVIVWPYLAGEVVVVAGL